MTGLPYSIAGFAVGAIVGLTGVGGGSLMTPILVLFFGVPAATAVGTDLLFAGITKSAGALSHGLKRNVDWKLAALLAAGSLPGAALALGALASFPASSRAAAGIVSAALGVMLLLTALSLAFRSQLMAWARSSSRDTSAAHRTAATIATGAFIGAAVTLSSVGAGAVGVAALLFLYPALASVRIVGTDIAHAIPLTLIAGAGHAWLGHVDAPMLASLVAGSIPGILAGSWLATRTPEPVVRHSLAVMLVIAGGKLVIR
ncbi:MAG: sulfite exporter TauE/SafE family protein [Betaproteobacteria bacterium]